LVTSTWLLVFSVCLNIVLDCREVMDSLWCSGTAVPFSEGLETLWQRSLMYTGFVQENGTIRCDDRSGHWPSDSWTFKTVGINDFTLEAHASTSIP